MHSGRKKSLETGSKHAALGLSVQCWVLECIKAFTCYSVNVISGLTEMMFVCVSVCESAFLLFMLHFGKGCEGFQSQLYLSFN